MDNNKSKKKDDQFKFENELVSKLNYYTVLCSNSYGVMYEFDEPNFIESLQMIDKSKPVADLGVAYGYSTKRLLNDGYYVFANDLSKDMLNTLYHSVPKDQLSHLKLCPGNVLTDISFPSNSLGAIFALRFMHFLKGDDFRQLFKKYYDWLSPGGILVVTCATSLYHFISSFQNEYKTNLQLELDWPGELELAGNLNPFKMINFISLDVLIREATLAGFHIIKANYIGRDLKEDHFTKFGRNKENFSSLIAVKDIFKI